MTEINSDEKYSYEEMHENGKIQDADRFYSICKNCIYLLEKSRFLKDEQIVKTSKGEFKLKIKKKKQNKFVILIHNSKYSYSLLNEEFDDQIEMLKEFKHYCRKLEEGKFKIIKNFEALDSHYRRIFTRVRYGILIL